MKYCEEYGPLLDAYVDGELSPADTLRAAEHLKTCGGCRAYVDAALSIRAAFPGEAEEAEVPAEFAAGVLSAIRAGAAPQTRTPPAKRREFPWKRLALPLAACLALAVFAGQAGWDSVRNSFRADAAVVRDSGSPESAGQADGAAAQNAPAEAKAAARIAGSADTDFAEYAEDAREEAAPAPDPGGTETSGGRDSAADRESYFVYTANDAMPPVPALSASAAPDARTEALEDAAEAGAKKPAENAISVTLTPDQGGALADVLAGCTLERMDDDGGSAVYFLTADQFEAVLAELERLNIPASVTEADAAAERRLYVQYNQIT